MMELLDSLFSQGRFFAEMAILCVIYALSLEKRDRFLPRLILGALTGFLISGLLPAGDVLLFVEGLLLAAGLVVLCYRISFPDGLYCAACAYATQHFYYASYTIIRLFQKGTEVSPVVLGLESILLEGTVFALFYWLFARRLADGKQYYVDARRSVFSVVMLLAVVLGLSLATDSCYVQDGWMLYLICRAYSMFCCVFFLGMQVSQVRQKRLQEQLAFERQLSRQRREQYEISRENIDIINRKCHDLKHQVAALRTCVPQNMQEKYLAEIDRCVQIYDSAVKTGCEVLDTVLTEKSLYCEAHQIEITCVADGPRLEFMDPLDVYTIVGNAIDNAIESVIQEEDPMKRIVSVSVTARSGLLILQFDNWCPRPLELDGSLPRTTKPDASWHGFGLRSIQYTVEKYGGCMTIRQENSVFLLCLSIPIPERSEIFGERKAI